MRAQMFAEQTMSVDTDTEPPRLNAASAGDSPVHATDCEHCGRACDSFFDLSSAIERAVDGTVHAVEARESVSVACFLCRDCIDLVLTSTLQAVGAAPLSDIADSEIYKRCAVCLAPIETDEWRTTYSQSESDASSLYLLSIRCRVCVCKNCSDGLDPAMTTTGVEVIASPAADSAGSSGAAQARSDPWRRSR